MENLSVPVANPPCSGPVSPSTPEENSQPGVVIRMKGRPRLTWLDSCLLGRREGMITEQTQHGPTRFWRQTGDEKPESRWFVVFVLLMPSLFFRCYLRLLVCRFGPRAWSVASQPEVGLQLLLLLPLAWPVLQLNPQQTPLLPPRCVICDPSCQQRCAAADGRVQIQFSEPGCILHSSSRFF